ncbi:MAG: hypothetical protein ACRDHL_10490, partial [Candidatus Promineifilaceae bacterium]
MRQPVQHDAAGEGINLQRARLTINYDFHGSLSETGRGHPPARARPAAVSTNRGRRPGAGPCAGPYKLSP